jgi:hypothetical protein
MHIRFRCESQKERNCLEDLGVNGRKGWGGMDWIHLAQDMDQSMALCEYGNEISSS